MEQNVEFHSNVKEKKTSLETQLTTYQKKIEEDAKVIRELYLDKVKGILSENDFLNLSKDFTNDRERLEKLVIETQKQLDVIERKIQTGDNRRQLIEQYTNLEHLDRETVETPVSYTHLTLEVYGLGYKLFLAIETGIFITAGTLPLIVLVVFFSKTYVFSILLCVFYSVLNMSATALFDALPKTILWFLPTPLTTFWSAGDMAAHGIKMDLEQMTGLIPSTFQVVMILGIMAIISFGLIDRLYKQRGE